MNKQRYVWLPDSKPTIMVSAMSEVEDYNFKLMNVPEMWKITRGAGVKVAILDTGLPQHIDLPEPEGKSFVDGYTYDIQGHATHTTGILAALADGTGVVGIAPDCTVVHGTVLDESGSGTVDAIVEGIRWAVDIAKVDIISLSLGIQTRDTLVDLRDACDYAYAKGVAVFAAAGNENGPVGQPASYDSVFAVAAVDSKYKRASFSDYGDQIDFAAGGVNVYSTYLNNTYAKMSGTSQACPALVGVAALILSDSLRVGVRLTPEQLRAKLNAIAYNPDNPGGYDQYEGRGIPVFSNATPVVEPVLGWWAKVWLSVRRLLSL